MNIHNRHKVLDQETFFFYYPLDGKVEKRKVDYSTRNKFEQYINSLNETEDYDGSKLRYKINHEIAKRAVEGEVFSIALQDDYMVYLFISNSIEALKERAMDYFTTKIDETSEQIMLMEDHLEVKKNHLKEAERIINIKNIKQ